MGRNLIIHPSVGDFDLVAVRAALEAQPDVLLDPCGSGRYMLCGSPHSVANRWRERKKSAPGFPHVTTLRVAPNEIYLNQEAANTYGLRSALEFLRWLSRTFPIHIEEDGYSDLTEHVRSHGVDSLYPTDVREMPLPWESELIKLGFYRELDHYDMNDFSIHERVADTPQEDEDRLVRYLEDGKIYRTSNVVSLDALDDGDEDITIGPAHLLTDGTYVWPAYLPHYVRKYHVQLLTPFVIHARRNGWKVPGDIDVTQLKMAD